MIELISKYAEKSQGLEIQVSGEAVHIRQKVDGRSLKFSSIHIEEVLSRQDSDGNDFLQVNFLDGRKILITDRLVGFKPAETAGLDIRKLPKVVTTPDLVSVVEAIEESVNSHGHRSEEVDVLRRVYVSVLNGAEAVGFDVESERNWVSYIANVKHKPSA